ncbi:hypothetical protein HZA26_01780 [Candidatus Nomurabacteria bacterium]|nr:hypothetical protein [Candidatus Nomurabacteria bacterium]
MKEGDVNKKLNIGKKGLSHIRMTPLEKKNMLKNILGGEVSSKKPTPSPYVFYSFMQRWDKNHVASYALISCLVVFLSSGVVLASKETLPGNILYPFKTKVVEPVYGAFLFSPESEIEYESSLAVKRFEEAEALADEDKLDDSKEERINALLEKHIADFNKSIAKLERKQTENKKKDDNNDDYYDNDELVTNFQARMNAHAQVLDIIKGNKDEPEEAKKEPVEKEQVKKAEIRKTARNNAERLRETLQKKERGEEKNEEKYNKRKNNIQTLLDSTKKDLDENKSENSERKKTVIKDANERLEKAKQALKEAEEEDKKGDSRNAYKKLLDSESSAKEAEFFLKAGLKLKD